MGGSLTHLRKTGGRRLPQRIRAVSPIKPKVVTRLSFYTFLMDKKVETHPTVHIKITEIAEVLI